MTNPAIRSEARAEGQYETHWHCSADAGQAGNFPQFFNAFGKPDRISADQHRSRAEITRAGVQTSRKNGYADGNAAVLDTQLGADIQH